jgi:predicted nuclease of predicted toxin-antitoxin system
LRNAGIEAEHWWNIGIGDAPDSELLDWAIAHEAVILTNDGDFSQMLALGGLARPSVIYLRTSELKPQGPGERVIAAYASLLRQPEAGCIVTIDDRSTRMRSLPLAVQP